MNLSFTKGFICFIAAIAIIPHHIVEQSGFKPIVQLGFIFSSLALFFIGLFNSRNQTGYTIFQKFIAVIVLFLLMTCFVQDTLKNEINLDAYKIFFIAGFIFFASDLVKTTDFESLMRLYWKILSIYILVMVSTFIARPKDELFFGEQADFRLNLLSSPTLVATFCLTYGLVALSAYRYLEGRWQKISHLFLTAGAFYIMFATASRQVALIFGLYLIVKFVYARTWKKRMQTVKIISLAMVLFLLFSAFVNDTLIRRFIFNPQEDYTSGRAVSISLWLEKKEVEGSPLGIGYIGENINYELMLLWPHNEVVRLFIEGGYAGLFFVLTIMSFAFLCMHKSLRVIREPISRAVIIVSFLEVMTQILLNNYFNNIYRASFVFLILAMAGAYASRVSNAQKISLRSEYARLQEKELQLAS